jgi:flagellum-specific ATP synthase
MPLDDFSGVMLGDRVVPVAEQAMVPVGDHLLGAVIDSTFQSYLGESYDLSKAEKTMPISGSPINPMERTRIEKPIDLGVRVINACLTCGQGQRQGIFAGSGVGKSVLLGMMARYTAADVVVIALLGERGREVKEFIENELGLESLKKSVVVVETADKSPIRRARCALAASCVAEHFRNQGKQVLLLMDSLTRYAMALREIGLASGEPPTTKGYPPSVFSSLSRLVERAGTAATGGSITGLYTVLVEGDDLEDPVADSARAILDGHIVLSRKLANRGHYPAIDLLASVSRLMSEITDKDHRKAARSVKELYARYAENEDAIQYGMYVRGTDPLIDASIEKAPEIDQFLRQDREERATFEDSKKRLEEI